MIHDDATHLDVLKGVLHGYKLIQHLAGGGESITVDSYGHHHHLESSLEFANLNSTSFVSALMSEGWKIDHLFLERTNLRYKVFYEDSLSVVS
jgi:hypothetical protein